MRAQYFGLGSACLICLQVDHGDQVAWTGRAAEVLKVVVLVWSDVCRYMKLHTERTCVYIYIYIYMCVCTGIRTQKRDYEFKYNQQIKCIYIYLYIYTHTYIHTYIYIYIY